MMTRFVELHRGATGEPFCIDLNHIRLFGPVVDVTVKQPYNTWIVMDEPWNDEWFVVETYEQLKALLGPVAQVQSPQS